MLTWPTSSSPLRGNSSQGSGAKSPPKTRESQGGTRESWSDEVDREEREREESKNPGGAGGSGGTGGGGDGDDDPTSSEESTEDESGDDDDDKKSEGGKETKATPMEIEEQGSKTSSHKDETWSDYHHRKLQEKLACRDRSKKFLLEKYGRDIKGSILPANEEWRMIGTWPTDPDHVAISTTDELGTSIRLKIETHRDPNTDMGDRFPEHLRIWYDGTDYKCVFETEKFDKTLAMSIMDTNRIFRAFDLPTLGGQEIWRLVTLPELLEKRSEGWDIDQQNKDLKRRENMISAWRTAGIVACVTSKNDHLKHPGLQLRYASDMYGEHEFAAELTGTVNQKKLPSTDIIPPFLKEDWEDANDKGHEKPRDLAQGIYASDNYELVSEGYFPKASLSMVNLIKSHNQYSINRVELYSNDGRGGRYNRARVPAVRDIFGRHATFPTTPFGERHNEYTIFGTRNRVPEHRWPKGIRSLLLVHNLQPSINDVRVFTDCCDRYYVDYKMKGSQVKYHLTWAEKTNTKAKPYGGRSADDVLHWWMKVTDNVRLATWVEYNTQGKHKSMPWIHNFRKWYQEWQDAYDHPLPTPPGNPMEIADDVLLDYLVRLDVHWHSMVMPVTPTVCPMNTKSWMGNIARCWHNLQEFISRDSYQVKQELERREQMQPAQTKAVTGASGTSKTLGGGRLSEPPAASSTSAGLTAAQVVAGAKASSAGETSTTVRTGESPSGGLKLKLKGKNLGIPGRRAGPPTFVHDLQSRGFGTAAGSDVSEAVKERIVWMNDAWRKALFEYCEYGREIIPDVLKTSEERAKRVQQTHEEDGTYVLYVQKLIAGKATRMDAADFEIFKVNLAKTLTQKMKEGHLTRRLQITDKKFVIVKGMAIICCANQHSLEIANLIVQGMELPNRYQTSLSAFNETWAIKFAFPHDYEFEEGEELLNTLKVHNRGRFDFIEEWPNRHDARGSHQTVIIECEEKDAKQVLQGGEIFNLPLGYGFVMGRDEDLPALSINDICKRYRKELKIVESMNKQKLVAEVVEMYSDLPQPDNPVPRSWDVICKDEASSDTPEVKNYRDQLSAIYPDWRKRIPDSTQTAIANYTYRTIDKLADAAQQTDDYHLKKYDRNQRFLQYPVLPEPLNLPQIDDFEVRYEEYVTAIDELRHEKFPNTPECEMEVADEKLRLLQFITATKRIKTWNRSTNKDVRDLIKDEVEKRSRVEGRKKMKRLEDQKNRKKEGWTPAEQAQWEKEDYKLRHPEAFTKITFARESEITDKIKEIRDRRKRKRDPSPEEDPKQRKSSDDAMEI